MSSESDRLIYGASAYANIAVAKYWGKRDTQLNLPFFDSVSFSVAALKTETKAQWCDDLDADSLNIDGWQVPLPQMCRVTRILDEIRLRKSWNKHCILESHNSFPRSSGLASSASGCAAAAIAASGAAGLEYSQAELSVLARLGSGSAARSVLSGWVRWFSGTRQDGLDSYAVQIAPHDYWPLCVFVVQVTSETKPVSSRDAMLRCQQSPLWKAYMADAQKAADVAENAIKHKDFALLAEVMHHSALMLHALTLSCSPPICYFAPKSIELLQFVLRACRALNVCCTLDAGANVVVLCEEPSVPFVKNQIMSLGVPFIQTEIV